MNPITNHEIIQGHFDGLLETIKEPFDFESKDEYKEHMEEIYRKTFVLKELIKIIYR